MNTFRLFLIVGRECDDLSKTQPLKYHNLPPNEILPTSCLLYTYLFNILSKYKS